MTGKSYLVVRAEVADAADRPAFDRWYSAEHLPQAIEMFGAEKGWRCWSRTNPAVHYAFYEFNDFSKVQSVIESETIRLLIADFDRRWGTRVQRTREILELADDIG